MGRAGTEVARQASDVVLTDDDFATLVEALVEGRGCWRNMRNALALLLGGKVGEVGTCAWWTKSPWHPRAPPLNRDFSLSRRAPQPR